MNLPQKIVFSQNREIHFVYTAEGQKLRKTTYVDGQKVATRDYAAGMEYLNQTLDFVSQPEGRVLVMPGKKLRYEYALRDHLGDTRITFSDLDQNGLIEKSKGEIIQENHYDPFGMELTGIWQKQWDAHHETAYRYNGKEFNADFGLNWSDYGARWYDATVGRWWVFDPLAEITQGSTPYGYVDNNPISYIDPFGLSKNWFQRAWHWIKTGGAETMDREGRTYVKEKQKELRNSTHVTLYYANFTNLTTKQLTKITKNAGDILSKNGMSA